jgi:hypothetical protein
VVDGNNTITKNENDEAATEECEYTIGQSIKKFSKLKQTTIFNQFFILLRIFVRFDYYDNNLDYIHYLGYSHKPIKKGKEAHNLDIECFSYWYPAF